MRLAITLLALSLTLATPAAAETLSGKMNTNTKVFAVIPDNSGTVQITVMGQRKLTFLVLAIDGDGEILWCTAVSDEQLARCDSGGLAGEIVVIGIATLSGSQKFNMNVTGPVDENVTRLSGNVIQRLHERMRALQWAAG